MPTGGRTGYGPVVLQPGFVRHAGGSGNTGGDAQLDSKAEPEAASQSGDAGPPPPIHSVWTTVWTTDPSPSIDEGTRR
jgi:hypothetical protein